MIRLQETPQGVILSVRAQPGAKRNAIAGEHDGALRVAVTTAPDKGKANDAIISVLAESFQLAKSSITLQSGARSRQKTFLLQAVSLKLVKAWVAELVS